MPEQTVTVPLAALRTLIGFADSMRFAADQEFLCSYDEQEQSDRGFAAIVNALGVDELTRP